MSSGFVMSLAFGIGVVAGLRSMTAPVAVAWAARLHWFSLSGSPLAFMGSRFSVAVFTLAALAEFVGDVLPTAPARTTPFPLMVRCVVGFLTGACLAVGGGTSLWIGGAVGAVGSIAGAFAGYRARVGLVRALEVADALIAIPEDVIAAGLGLILVSRFYS